MSNLLVMLKQRFPGIIFCANKMTYREFRKRVNHNTAVLRKALETGQSLITILPDLYTMTSKPGELHSSTLMRNSHDMLPAAYYGALANLDNNGADAYVISPKGDETKIEFKTSEIDSRKIWQGPRGGLYIGKQNTPSDRTGVTSVLCASYALHTDSIKQAKKIKTVLMICDIAGTDGYFDAWEMDGDTVLNNYLHNKGHKADIKLGSFMKHGRRARTLVALRGVESWMADVRTNAAVMMPVNEDVKHARAA
jgi:hypothetical protein